MVRKSLSIKVESVHVFHTYKDEVDTSQLLKSLQSAAGQEALADGPLKAVGIASLRNGHLVAVIGLDFSELLDERRVRGIQTAELAERFGRGLVLVPLDQEAGGLG